MTIVDDKGTEMQDLIRRLEKAAGPDRELDIAIATATGWSPYVLKDQIIGDENVWKEPNGIITASVRRFTESVDAAITLTDGRPWTLRTLGRGCEARVGGKIPDEFFIKGGEHATPAIALCIAALTARVA